MVRLHPSWELRWKQKAQQAAGNRGSALGCCGLLNLLYFLLVPRAGIRFQSDQLQCNIHSAHRATMETRQIAIDEAMSASHRSFERGV